MTRTARKGQVSAQFFRVDGADQQTGEETYLVLQAPTKPQAEKLAREQGLLISAVRVARPDDWSPPPVAATPPAPLEPPPQFEPEPSPTFQELQPTPEPRDSIESAADPSPFIDVPSPAEPAPQPSAPTPSLAAAPQSPAAGSSAASVVLGCIGGALVLGGVLALVLALWPDNAVRNELQQFDYRLHELSQTILGSVLVLGGLMIFVLAVICHLLGRRPAAA